MKPLFVFSLFIGLVIFGSGYANAAAPNKIATSLANSKGCLSCHTGIEDIREDGSEMLNQVRAIGAELGDPGGCVTCHGGNPRGLTPKEAHKGAPRDLVEGLGPQTFYPDPGSIWIANRTCGQCHADYTYRLERALMNTEAGKIQGNLHTWGIKETFNHKVPWGNYDVADTDGPEPMVGTDAYKNT